MTRTMMMVFVDADHASDVEKLLDECDLPGYTEFPRVHGKGRSGKKFGTRAFPGSNTLYLVMVDDDCRAPLIERLAILKSTEHRHAGLRVYASAAEEVV
jgi:hypothetical protein